MFEFNDSELTTEELQALGRSIRDTYCKIIGISDAEIGVAYKHIYNGLPPNMTAISGGIVIYDQGTSGLGFVQQLPNLLGKVAAAMVQQNDHPQLTRKFVDFQTSLGVLKGNKGITLGELGGNLESPEDTESQSKNSPASPASLIPNNTAAWYYPPMTAQTRAERARLEGKKKAAIADPPPVPVLILGFRRVEGEVFYNIASHRNPLAEGKPKKSETLETPRKGSRYVPANRISLERKDLA